MFAGAAFNLDIGQFTAGEVALVCGVSRAVIDMWGLRGFIRPTRREQLVKRSIGGKRAQSKSGKGRPLFSARDIFKARLLRSLAAQLGMPLTDSVSVAEKAQSEEIALPDDMLADAAKFADTVAMSGEWMWATARSVEKGKPFYVYAYATRADHEWRLDMHIESPGEPPCFGWDVPHVYIPMSDIFRAIYLDCKRMLGPQSA